jgi:predicted RNA-binding Zn-ribbon protein involved in translation (DUF1610 family)
VTPAYELHVTCLHCGGTIAHVTSSVVYAGTECSAIGRCAECGREWQVSVHLRPVLSLGARRQRRHRERVEA